MYLDAQIESPSELSKQQLIALLPGKLTERQRQNSSQRIWLYMIVNCKTGI